MWISFSGVLRMRPIDASLQFRYNTVQYAAPKRAALHCTKEVIQMDPVAAGLLAVSVVVVFGLAFWLYSGMRRESRLAKAPLIARLGAMRTQLRVAQSVLPKVRKLLDAGSINTWDPEMHKGLLADLEGAENDIRNRGVAYADLWERLNALQTDLNNLRFYEMPDEKFNRRIDELGRDVDHAGRLFLDTADADAFAYRDTVA